MAKLNRDYCNGSDHVWLEAGTPQPCDLCACGQRFWQDEYSSAEGVQALLDFFFTPGATRIMWGPRPPRAN